MFKIKWSSLQASRLILRNKLQMAKHTKLFHIPVFKQVHSKVNDGGKEKK